MISFIVPAYNEEELLGATLHALHAAAAAVGEAYEIVVADDASSDATVSIAQRCGARVIEVAHRQIAATRNAGARAAQGDRFIFVDADTVVGAEVVRAALQALAEGAVGGGAAVRFDGRIPRWAGLALPAFVWAFRVSGMAAGCFLFCTKPAFEAVGGFDDTLYAAEEIFMSRALKRHGRFVVLEQAVVTSGRKLRAYTAGELLRIAAPLAWRGWGAVRSRDGLELWYERRREGPGA
ncbi:MAG TPA: glycosyltransferase [Casimicrobiaceae bacterium]|nr:glycosyltransferase [Casimicrobiaceae bacterium]